MEMYVRYKDDDLFLMHENNLSSIKLMNIAANLEKVSLEIVGKV